MHMARCGWQKISALPCGAVSTPRLSRVLFNQSSAAASVRGVLPSEELPHGRGVYHKVSLLISRAFDYSQHTAQTHPPQPLTSHRQHLLAHSRGLGLLARAEPARSRNTYMPKEGCVFSRPVP